MIKTVQPWLLIVLSAAVYAAACIIPACAVGMLFFLLPIFYAAHRYKLTFIHGFVWGIIIYLCVGWCIILLLHEHAHGVLRYAVALLFVLYCALHSAVWFLIPNLIRKMFPSSIIYALTWWGLTYSYCEFSAQHLFWIVDYQMGNPFCYPLVPLMTYQWCTYIMVLLRPTTMLMLIIVSNYLLATVVLPRNYLLNLLILSLWLVSALVCVYSARPVALSDRRIACIIPQKRHYSAYESALQIAEQLQQLSYLHPTVNLIILPESSISCALNTMPHIPRWWADNVPEDVTIIVGSHRLEHHKLFNTLYVLKNGVIDQWYDKQKVMSLTEYVPYHLTGCTWAQALFLQGQQAFDSAPACPCVMTIEGKGYIPLICSELFFTTTLALREPENALLLAVINETWFSVHYMYRLMWLTARFKALNWGKPLIYVGYTYAGVCGKEGEWEALPCI
jgi:apolipoprotein N-acyltransferase